MGFWGGMARGIIKTMVKTNSFETVKDLAPNQIGVYIMSYQGKVMYIGRAIEDRPGQSTKGLRKRLQEHWRGAANCKQELFQHRDEITVSIRTCSSVEEAKRLEAALIRKYDTVNKGWNLRYEG
jgi:excinuclease UvrABC nuclease subunit